MKETEVWKDIPGFEGYQASSFGRIRSVDRVVKSITGPRNYKGRILKQSKRGEYLCIRIGERPTENVHILIAMTYHGHQPNKWDKVVNHKDLDKHNNRPDNIEIITQRENANKRHIKSSSKYTGVSWEKDRQKWKAYIHIDGKLENLGRYDTEEDAHEARQSRLLSL